MEKTPTNLGDGRREGSFVTLLEWDEGRVDPSDPDSKCPVCSTGSMRLFPHPSGTVKRIKMCNHPMCMHPLKMVSAEATETVTKEREDHQKQTSFHISMAMGCEVTYKDVFMNSSLVSGTLYQLENPKVTTVGTLQRQCRDRKLGTTGGSKLYQFMTIMPISSLSHKKPKKSRDAITQTYFEKRSVQPENADTEAPIIIAPITSGQLPRSHSRTLKRTKTLQGPLVRKIELTQQRSKRCKIAPAWTKDMILYDFKSMNSDSESNHSSSKPLLASTSTLHNPRKQRQNVKVKSSDGAHPKRSNSQVRRRILPSPVTVRRQSTRIASSSKLKPTVMTRELRRPFYANENVKKRRRRQALGGLDLEAVDLDIPDSECVLVKDYYNNLIRWPKSMPLEPEFTITANDPVAADQTDDNSNEFILL